MSRPKYLLPSTPQTYRPTYQRTPSGNTVYVGLGVFQKTESVRWIKSLISILSFCIGSLFFSSFHRYFSPRRRWVFLTSFALQALLIAAATVLVTVAAADPEPVIWQNVLPIVMLSFQSSGQAVASRVLQYNELPTVVLTSTYCDLMSDPQLFTARLPDNSKRNRRVAAVVMAVGGAILGGFFARTWTGIAGGLWVAAGLKGAVALVWSVWIAEAVSGEEEE
ncbi:MAG: hypothetical protein FRX48_07981 [Lasallia pustulata]|uniref:DUF1275 domain n=1 Tax=Lasallia pustulata TaxID=136370 RepID=A0A5M8PFX0_9LECA|nr:MAG: hypothetical protein FRX48_07981 [Lasallia pustulata]